MSEFFESRVPDPPDPAQMYVDMTFWQMAVNSLKRVVVVHPDHESRFVETVRARGLEGIITVVTNQHMVKDKAYLFDGDSFEAALMARSGRFLRLDPED